MCCPRHTGGIRTSIPPPGQWSCGKCGPTGTQAADQEHHRGGQVLGEAAAQGTAPDPRHTWPTSLSPYQIVSGRDRLLAGIPYQPARLAEIVEQFMARMQHMDDEIASVLNDIHRKRAGDINARRREPPPCGLATRSGTGLSASLAQRSGSQCFGAQE